MKISIDCECLLLRESLKLFLEEFQTPIKDCDFVVCDRFINSNKPIFTIGDKKTELSVPFTKEKLISALKEFNSKIIVEKCLKKPEDNIEKKIDILFDKFKTELITLIKYQYEK